MPGGVDGIRISDPGGVPGAPTGGPSTGVGPPGTITLPAGGGTAVPRLLQQSLLQPAATANAGSSSQRVRSVTTRPSSGQRCPPILRDDAGTNPGEGGRGSV